MSRTYRVEHHTTYRYGVPMTDGYSVACLVPRPTDHQQVVSSEVGSDPEPSESDSYLDAFGNLVHQFGWHEPHDATSVSATSVVTVDRWDLPDDATPWEEVAGLLAGAGGDLAVDVAPMRARSTFIDVVTLAPWFATIAEHELTPGRPLVDAAVGLCERIHREFDYDPHFSDVSTPIADVLAQRRGVCQDFAHLMIGCLRAEGLAARYVSGYLETVPPPGEERLVGADASHAWCSVWTPSGWLDLDPTNGHAPVNDHVTVAWGRDYADVTPVRGVMIGPATEQTLEVAVDVQRLEGKN